MGVLKRGAMIGKDLLEDTPVPGDLCHHRVAPSKRDPVVGVKRFYHASAVSSTPDRPTLRYSQATRLSLSHEDFWNRKNAFSFFYVAGCCQAPFYTFLFPLLFSLRAILQRPTSSAQLLSNAHMSGYHSSPGSFPGLYLMRCFTRPRSSWRLPLT